MPKVLRSTMKASALACGTNCVNPINPFEVATKTLLPPLVIGAKCWICSLMSLPVVEVIGDRAGEHVIGAQGAILQKVVVADWVAVDDPSETDWTGRI